MREMREQGLSYKKIAEELGVSFNTVPYYLNPKARRDKIKSAEKWNKKMTREQKTKKSREHIPYGEEYLKERYNNDEEFRERYKKLVKKSFKKRRKRWLIQGLCSMCGRVREDKQFRQCERCRERGRKKEESMLIPVGFPPTFIEMD